MARFRLRPIVNTQKHETTWSLLQLNASSQQNIALVTATDRGTIDTANPDEVAIGSKIKWIYLEFHFNAEVTGNTNVVHWKVEIQKAGSAASVPNLYNQDDKSFIIKRGMEMLPKAVSTVFKRITVVKIPRNYQRISQGMLIKFRFIASSADQINTCGFAIFKEQT